MSVPTSVLNPSHSDPLSGSFPPNNEKPPEAELSDPHLFIIFLELFFSQDLSVENQGMSGFPAHRIFGVFIAIHMHTDTPSYTSACALEIAIAKVNNLKKPVGPKIIA